MNDPIGQAGFLGRKDKHMVLAGDPDLADILRRELTGNILIKGVDGSLITAAMAGKDAIAADGDFCRQLALFTGGKIIELKGLIAHIAEQLTVGGHNMGLSAALGEGTHRHGNGDIAVEDHVDGLMIHHVIIALINALTVLAGL